MAASVIRRLYLFVPGFIGEPVSTLSGLFYGMLTTNSKSAYRLSKICLSPRLKYGSKATDCARDELINIPVDRLTVTYSRSSGPGGQHVNKVNTKAEVRFHVQTADWIPAENKNRINKAGELLVTSEVSRSQQRNLEDCLQKINDIISKANQKPQEPTAEDVALRQARLEHRNQERLKQKKMHSTLKQNRRVDFD
ncbi:peptidyl-tRNA hydrolase ICT1, mitochondrial isoform X2 [Megalops cyprinoides]|uniref:peptidyl-tRNA hydrolase ICT1, mitochondrial isoform X2 n=1 Tax=Megalops cyprinoides TaxID=118141 RepID=UPI0018649383|nr:peptidyl-tRNA hydrolase ICT1, mitochondrial isoform X2 [Megalops cyprinoides]